MIKQQAETNQPKQKTLKLTLAMALPAIIESFFNAFAGLVDSYMVSSLGANAVAAIGLTTQPKFIGLALFFATGVAVSALVARRRGEQRQDDANRLLITTLIFAIVSSVAISIAFVMGADFIMDFCGSTENTHAYATSYFKIIAAGYITNAISIVVNSAQRGAGNTTITMRTNIVANVVNIILNYLLIEGHFGFPAWGIEGAAIATVTGYGVSAIMSICSILPKNGFISLTYIFREKIIPTLKSFKELVKVGYSVFCEQLLMRIGFVATAIMAADMGDEAMAAHQVAMNIMGLSFAFGDGLQAAAVALIGRSLGEKKEELAKRYGKTCQNVGLVISFALSLLYFFGARALYSLYFEEETIIEIGIGIMMVIIFVVVFQVRQVIYMGCLRGAGDTLYTAISSTISVTLVRTAASYIFGYIVGWGIFGVWLGVLADQISRFIFASVRFKQGKWTKIKI